MLDSLLFPLNVFLVLLKASKQRHIYEPLSGVAAWPWTLWSGEQRVTHKGWVASVCLGDFTLFRQALQECPTIRPIGSGSTDLLRHHWLIWRPAVWKHCLCNLLSLCSCLHMSPTVCSATVQTRWVFPYVRPLLSLVTVKTTLASLHNGSQSGKRRPRFMTDRWEMLHLGLNPVSQPSYWFERINCLVTMFLCGFLWHAFTRISQFVWHNHMMWITSTEKEITENKGCSVPLTDKQVKKDR